MKCSVCGKEIKDKFYKVYPTQGNEYYTMNRTLFVCHNCVRVRTVKVFKVKQGYKLQDLEFTEYKDCNTYANPYVYKLSLEEKLNNLINKLEKIKDIDKHYYLQWLLEEDIKILSSELKQLENGSDV